MSSVVSVSSRGRHSAPDPGGFNPSGRRLITGEEPVGLEPVSVSPRLPNSLSLQQPPTPVSRTNQQQHDGGHAPVMALLMQSPPSHHSNGVPRRSSSRLKSSEYAKISPISTAQTESTSESAYSSTPASQKSSTVNDLVQQRLRAARAIYESDTLALPPEPPEYSHGRPSQVATPVHKSAEPSPTSSLATQPHRNTQDASSSTSGGNKSRTSDNSGQTLTSNQAPLQTPAVVVANNTMSSSTARRREMDRRQNATEPRRRTKTPEKRRAKTPDPKRKTPEKRRKKTPERKRAAAETEVNTAEERKGFFRRMFRRNNKKDSKTVDGSEMEDTKETISTQSVSINKSSSASITVAPPLKQAASAPPKSAPSEPHQPYHDYLWPNQSMPDANMQRKSQQRSTSRPRRTLTQNPSTSMDESYDDRPEVFFAHDDVSTLTGPTVGEYDSRNYSYGSSSSRSMRDPSESLPHTTSTLSADPMGFYYQAYGPGAALANDPEESYEEEEQRRNRSRHKGGGSIDPFTEPFFKNKSKPAAISKLHVITEPDTNEQLKQKHRHDDPVGESPLSSRHRRERQKSSGSPEDTYKSKGSTRRQSLQDPSPRGYAVTPAQEHQDPFGASPVHKHDRGPSAVVDGNLFAPDPPLYRNDDESMLTSDTGPLDSVLAEYGGDDMSRISMQHEGEEKEEDFLPPPPPPPPDYSEKHVSPRVLQVVGPPPPPPPPPPPGSKKSKSKRPRIPKSPRKTSTPNSTTSYEEDTTPRALSPPPPPPPTDDFSSPSPSSGDASVDSAPPPSPAEDPYVQSPPPKSPAGKEPDTSEIPETSNDSLPDSLLQPQSIDSEYSTTEMSYVKRTSKAIQQARKARRREPREKRKSPRKSRESSESPRTTPDADSRKLFREKSESPKMSLPLGRKKSLDISTSPQVGVKSPNASGDSGGSPKALRTPTYQEYKERRNVTRSKKMKQDHATTVSEKVVREMKSKEKGKGIIKENMSIAKKAEPKEDPRVTEARTAKEKAMQIERAMKAKREAEEAELARIAQEALRAKKAAEEAEKSRQAKIQQSPKRKSRVFDSDTGEPLVATPKHDETTKTKKSYISSLARMNAKAVAYLHTLNGEPSPRHQWQTPNADETTESDHGNEEASAFFQAYSSKFKGRKLTTRITVSPRGGSSPTPRSRKVPPSPSWMDKPVERDIRIHGKSVAKGIAIRRANRDALIAAGKAIRIIPQPAKQKQSTPSSVMPEPKDPIQRAGRRLLAKAAIPIQAEIRRFLAQREAVDRMWALIEIQSYMRRWRAEAHMLASITAIVILQSIFRGFQVRSTCKKQNDAAIKVQKVVRGYLASVWAYDTVYSVILIQAQARRFAVRRRLALEHVAAIEIQRVVRGHLRRMLYTEQLSAITIQSQYRSHVLHRKYLWKKQAAKRVQTFWRMASARQAFQFVIVDVIIVQSVVRAYMARHELYRRRNAHLASAATRIQSKFRAYIARNQYVRNRAATKIQANWRCLKAYSEYILQLVDIVSVQRGCRRWLAKRRVQRIRENRAATKIQAQWRRFHSQMKLLYDLVHIIMVQSIVRRHFAKKTAWKRRIEYEDHTAAATRIQAAWRGFWKFSHFVILQYEVCRIQAATRSMQARKQYRLKLGSCILIQSIVRRKQAEKNFKELRRLNLMIHARASRMREELACEKIQFWWQVVKECRKEKKAALTIERFFISVKKEVEKEIKRLDSKKEKQKKRESKRRQKRESDDQMLERVWLNTVDENHVDVFAVPSSTRSMVSRAASPSVVSVASSSYTGVSSVKGHSRYAALSPSKKLVLRHENETPANSDMKPSFSFSSFHLSSRVNELKSKASQSDLQQNLDLEEAYLDASVEQEKKKRAADKYLKMYGVNLNTAPNRYSREFFSEATSPQGRKSLGNSQSADWRSPSQSNRSKAKEMAAKYLQNAQKQNSDDFKRGDKPSLRVEAILGEDIGMI